jgi:hypothetical protein
MEDVGTHESDNYIPQGFLPGPGLSREEAFRRMTAGAEKNLVNLAVQGIPIPNPAELTNVDWENRTSEDHRRARARDDRQKTPEEASEAERFDLAEAVVQLPSGYFYPGMPETRQRQLAAVISAGTPQIVDHNTPGIASTSAASNQC